MKRASLRFALGLAALAAVLGNSSPAFAAKKAISGAVVDRNGDAIERANVKLSPGNVEIITDDAGKFSIDYLRDEEGNRVKLAKRTHYTIEFFKVGFHTEIIEFDYKRGDLALELVTMKEDSIRVEVSNADIDPSKFPDRAQSSGGSYEGE